MNVYRLGIQRVTLVFGMETKDASDAGPKTHFTYDDIMAFVPSLLAE